MKRLTQSLFFAGMVLVQVPVQASVIVGADWFSNTTSIQNVVDPPFAAFTERLRLEGGFTSGFAEGVVSLPFFDTWFIESIIRTDGQHDIPSEFVEVRINNILVDTFINSPLSTNKLLSHTITGSQFTYRFDFSSPSIILTDHLIVQSGTVTSTTMPVPAPATLALFGLGLAGLGWSRRKA